nr:MAG TPA: putative DNA-binding protein [Caudoviricetes sp.]
MKWTEFDESTTSPQMLCMYPRGGEKVPKVLISLDEVDRVRRINHITSNAELADKIGVHRNTLRKYLKSRELDNEVINGLVRLGAKASKILVVVDGAELAAAA